MLLTVDFEKLNSLQDGDFLDPPKAAQILGLKYHAAYRLFKIGQIQSTVKPCNYNRSMGYFCTAAAIRDFLKSRKHRDKNESPPNKDKICDEALKERLECAVKRLEFLKNLPLSVPTAAKIIRESPFSTRQIFKNLPYFCVGTPKSGGDWHIKASDLKKFLQCRLDRKDYLY